ncbi:hypothetical protein AMTR_s00074p00156530 [Amborella trichopoda]|uniref:Uncharacterized protein n=2 Tax=Amborella trichopoda TaxID=13333 RepID=W1NM50_AMBTC|nr:hypothetical protein AMTR_s00074p00156530 [Amborella trichopoda]
MGARIITEPIILHVDIHVGNVVGIIIVTYALYLLFWGQGKDIITIAKILHFINEGNERKEDEEKAKMKDLANHIGEEGKVEMKIFAIPNIQEGFFDDEQGEMVEMNIATNKKLDEWLLGATIDCFED